MNRTEPAAAGDRSMDALYEALKSKQMGALWQQQAGPPPPGAMRGRSAPHLWHGSEVQSLMSWAAELVTPGPEAERRVLTLSNPGGTLAAAVQMVQPGEVAPSHRHTPAAIRFILQGRGATTIVDGEPCVMSPGDLVLTPAWSWHGHISEGDGPMLWMDGLDAPAIRALGAGFDFEEYPEGGIQPAGKPAGDSYNRYGAAHLRPLWGQATSNVSPLLVYPWRQTEQALRNLASVDASPFDDVAMEYTNPVTGGHVLPTIGCCVQLLRPGVHTQAHRHSTSAVYHVFRGRGSTVIDGASYDWEPGDFLLLPPRAWHEHINSSNEEAILFSITDGPIFESLNLYREEPYTDHGGHQPVTAGSSASSA
jgi:gentisate 1,2-dioxygenase